MRVSSSVIITILLLLFLIFREKQVNMFLNKIFGKPSKPIKNPVISDVNMTGGQVNESGCTQPKFTGRLACYDGSLFLPVDENKLICFGDNNCEVAKMQKRLNSLETNNIVAVDGSFGCYTLEKLKRIMNITGNCVRIAQLPVLN